jgi:hypothetical protein
MSCDDDPIEIKGVAPGQRNNVVDGRADVFEDVAEPLTTGADSPELRIPGCVPSSGEIHCKAVHQIALPALAPPTAM